MGLRGPLPEMRGNAGVTGRNPHVAARGSEAHTLPLPPAAGAALRQDRGPRGEAQTEDVEVRARPHRPRGRQCARPLLPLPFPLETSTTAQERPTRLSGSAGNSETQPPRDSRPSDSDTKPPTGAPRKGHPRAEGPRQTGRVVGPETPPSPREPVRGGQASFTNRLRGPKREARRKRREMPERLHVLHSASCWREGLTHQQGVHSGAQAQRAGAPGRAQRCSSKGPPGVPGSPTLSAPRR